MRNAPSSPSQPPRCARRRSGFTLIELMVVLSIIGLLLLVAMPRYMHSVDRSRETALKQDLAVMREALDKYHGDRGRYPDSLDDLVTRRYLRRVPEDPLTESPLSWVVVPPPETGGDGRVYDVKSGAPGKAMDGSAYGDW